MTDTYFRLYNESYAGKVPWFSAVMSTSDYTVYTRSWKPDTTDHQPGLENFTGWIAGINSGCPDIPTGGSYLLLRRPSLVFLLCD